MKRFKLIKEYPDSPKLGTIINFEQDSFNMVVKKRPNDLKDYPEFWEEVKEKEYTILSFIDNNGRKYFVNGHKVNAEDGFLTYTYESFLESKRHKIHSVRRQRDQEVFTLRDQMKALTTDSKNVTLFVEKIELIGDRIHLWGNNYSISLMCAEKAPIRKPILITEDKVEIYEGKILFGVSQSFRVYDENINKHVAESYLEGKKFFSTKEAAEEYIKWNKPMYSLNDISSSGIASDCVRDIIYELEKLGRK